jgi:transposase
VVEAALATAAAVPAPPVTPPAPTRWTTRQLLTWAKNHLGRLFSRETLRRALKRVGLSWKKAKKLLGKAQPELRKAYLDKLQGWLAEVARSDETLLVYLDEAHVHQDCDLGYGWAVKGQRYYVNSTSPGLSARVTFYGLYLYNEGQVRIWPAARGNGTQTVEVLKRLRAEFPTRKIKLIWDGAPYHRSGLVKDEAARLKIELEPLPGYSPDFMPVEALWRWLREEVTYNRCHASCEALKAAVAAFEQTVNADPCGTADRLWTSSHLDPLQEKLRVPR